MDKTKDMTTPGGRPVVLENPLSSEAGSMDSGGNQTLLRRSLLTPRTPPKRASMGNTAPRTPLNTDMQKNTGLNVKEIKLQKLAKSESEDTETECLVNQDFYHEWQKERKERLALEETVKTLQQQIRDIERKILRSEDKTNPLPNTPSEVMEFGTDEEELSRETDWVLKKSRQNKKRKAEESPELLTSNKENVSQKSTQNKLKNKEVQREKNIPPPIIVSGMKNFGDIRNMIKQATEKECKFVSYSNNVWKINTPDSDTYRAITNQLNIKKIQWHSYEDKATRPLKVMARGLHHSCEESDITEDLAEKGFRILEAKNIMKKESIEDEAGNHLTQKVPLPLFMLSFHNEENADKVFTINSILGLRVKIEPLRRKMNVIPQCKRCQAFGHTRRYCSRNFACVKCAGSHLTENCQLKRDQKAKCINCKGEHPASYRGCQVAKEQQNRKNKILNNSGQPQTKANNVTRIETTTRGTYAQTVKNTRREGEDTVRDVLALVVERLERQEEAMRALTEEISRLKGNTPKTSLHIKK